MQARLLILQEHCRAFERGLATVGTAEAAEALRAQSCLRLAESCHSELLQNLLSARARALIRERFLPAAAGQSSPADGVQP